MLVLSRKADESIIINGEIRVKVLGVSGNKVRLGIEAPNDIPIRREEIFEQFEDAVICASPIVESKRHPVEAPGYPRSV